MYKVLYCFYNALDGFYKVSHGFYKVLTGSPSARSRPDPHNLERGFRARSRSKTSPDQTIMRWCIIEPGRALKHGSSLSINPYQNLRSHLGSSSFARVSVRLARRASASAVFWGPTWAASRSHGFANRSKACRALVGKEAARNRFLACATSSAQVGAMSNGVLTTATVLARA